MAKSNDFGVGLMHEAAITASRSGWEPEDLARLSKDENLMKLIHGVLQGTHEIKEIKHYIDCDAAPFIPEGWKVEEHKRDGTTRFEPSKIELYLPQEQKNASIEGFKLYEKLKERRVLNANVLDYLLENPKAIPEEWKEKAIFFWGTIYRDFNGRFYVRCLYWCNDKWRWGSDQLKAGWAGNSPAALIKS